MALPGFTDIRPEERRDAWGAFLALFGILSAHTLLETARDALFLARLPPSQLPWVYLAMAVLAVAVSRGPWSGSRRLAGRYAFPLLLAFCAAVTFAFWLLGTGRSGFLLRALYVWTGLVGTLTAVQFWLVLSERYTITQAKRLYKIIGLGSVLGAVAGAALARMLTDRLAPEDMVAASALIMALTALGPGLLLRRPPSAAAPAEGSTALAQMPAMLKRHPYVTRLFALVLISTVALTLADYVFKTIVSRRLPPEALPSFFANFYLILNLLALLAQLLLAGLLLRVLGLHRALWVLPVLLLLGSVALAFGGGLLAACLLKGADGTLRHSLHRTGTELLFLPMSDALRSRVKPLIDVAGQRGGQALASILILGELGMNRGTAVLAAATAVLCIVWIAWAADLRPHYLQLFRTALREGTMQRPADLPDLDLHSLEALFAALNSQSDEEVVAALELLAQEGRVRLIPALILYHPSQAVVLRALELMADAGRTDFVPVADRLLGHAQAEVRAAALRARSRVAPEEGPLRAAAADPSLLVRAVALAGLVAGGWVSDEAQRTLDALSDPNDPEARRALARALSEQPAPVFETLFLELATSPDPEVQIPTARAMGRLQNERFLHALLPLLGPHEVRDAAREALLAYGDVALKFLADALGDPDLPHDLRRHLPRTISRFPASQAAPILLGRLLQETDGMVRFKILRGLGRLATDHPEVELDGAILGEATTRTVAVAFRLRHWSTVLARGAQEIPPRAHSGHELLLSLLRDKEAHARERLFRLLSLQFRHEDLESVYRGLENTDPRTRASSRELLENLLATPLRDAVLALVDDAPAEAALLRAAPYYEASPLTYSQLLERLLDEPGETLRCLAAYHVGELGLTELRGRLESLSQAGTGLFVTRVMERALRLLGEAPERLAHAR